MILVTGATGIVGRAVLKRLQFLGHEALGIVRSTAVNSGHLTIDLSQSESLVGQVPNVPSAILHLAAAVPHSPRYPDQEATADLTRRIDSCVFRSAKAWGCPVVYASTCGLYDRRSDLLKREEDSLSPPSSPYFAAKLDGERLLLELPNVTVARLSAPLGPGVPSTLVASTFILRAMNSQVLSVHGHGSREQNYVVVDDIAEALALAAQRGWKGILNIAARQPVTMLELAKRVIRTLGGGQLAIGERPDYREGETARYAVDRAEAVLGWRPSTPLEKGILDVSRYFKSLPAEGIS